MCYSLPFYCSKYEPIIWSSSNAFLYLRLRGSSPCYLSDLFNASENNTSTNLLSQALFCIFEIFILWHKINCKRLKFKKNFYLFLFSAEEHWIRYKRIGNNHWPKCGRLCCYALRCCFLHLQVERFPARSFEISPARRAQIRRTPSVPSGNPTPCD